MLALRLCWDPRPRPLPARDSPHSLFMFTVPPEASQRTGGKCTRGHALWPESNVLPGNPRAPKANRRRFTVKPGRRRAGPASPSLLSRANPLSRVGVQTLRVVLEIHKTVAVVQFHLKDPQHFKPQQTGNLRPGVAA